MSSIPASIFQAEQNKKECGGEMSWGATIVYLVILLQVNIDEFEMNGANILVTG